MGKDTLAERYAAEAKENEQLREWLIRQSYMTVADVAEHLSMSSSKIRGLPWAVLPYVDLTPDSERQTPRYHPEDVMALRGVLQKWKQAVDDDREEEWRQERREKLARRADLEDQAAMMEEVA